MVEWVTTGEEGTNEGYWKFVVVDDGVYKLWNQYGWPGPNDKTTSGPIKWSNGQAQYHGELSPFYYVLAGRVEMRSNPRLFGLGLVENLWSSTAAPGSKATGQGSLAISITGANYQSLDPGYGWGRAPGYSLRCLTQ